MLNRLVRALAFTCRLAHAALLTVFLAMVAALFAAWLGGGWPAVVGAAAVGLIAGTAVSKRVWFGRQGPPPPPPVLPELRQPGLQDEFERLLARQRVLAFLFVAAVLMLAFVRVAAAGDWPNMFGVPRDRVLAAALVAAAVGLVLGILNWRCPNCRRNLGGTLSVAQCPHCGAVLRG